MRWNALLLAVLAAAVAAVLHSPPAAAQPVAEARAATPLGQRVPPGFRLVVVNRDIQVNPGHRPSLAVLCLRGYAGVSWGFELFDTTQAGLTAAVLQGVRPNLRANGVPAGWTFTVFNPAPVGTGLPIRGRLQATCIQPINGSRIVSRPGSGRAQRRLETAAGRAARPTLALGVLDRRVNGSSIRSLCPRGEIAFSAGFTSEAGHELAGYVPVLGPRKGLELTFSRPPAAGRGAGGGLVVHSVCGKGQGGLRVGEDAADTTPRANLLKIQAVGLSPFTTDDSAAFTFTCGTPNDDGGFTPAGANLGLGFEITELAPGRAPAGSPTGRPLVLDWSHPALDQAGRFAPWARRLAVVADSSPISVAVHSLCLKARQVVQSTFRGRAALLLRLAGRPVG